MVVDHRIGRGAQELERQQRGRFRSGTCRKPPSTDEETTARFTRSREHFGQESRRPPRTRTTTTGTMHPDPSSLLVELEQLERREREVSAFRKRLHDRLDSFPNDVTQAHERQVSAERRELHAPHRRVARRPSPELTASYDRAMATTEARAQALLDEISELYAILLRISRRVQHDEPMTATQRLALIEIAVVGPLRLHELAARMDTTDATASRAVDVLEEHRFVARRPDPVDRRAIQVAVTAKGRRWSGPAACTAPRSARRAPGERRLRQAGRRYRAPERRAARSDRPQRCGARGAARSLAVYPGRR